MTYDMNALDEVFAGSTLQRFDVSLGLVCVWRGEAWFEFYDERGRRCGVLYELGDNGKPIPSDADGIEKAAKLMDAWFAGMRVQDFCARCGRSHTTPRCLTVVA